VIKLWADGSGNSSQVSTGSITLSNPQGLATDAAGNLYIANYGNSTVVVAKPDGTAFVLTTSGVTINNPEAIAVDPAGNVFILDKNGVEKVRPDGTTTTLSVNAVSILVGIAVDGTGTLYVLGYQGKLMEIAPNGTQTMLSISGLSIDSAGGLAVDPAGNIYVADGSNNRVVKIWRDTLDLNFASTAQGATSSDSARTATVRNIGNEPLAISAISYPADFPEAAGVSTDCAPSSSLAVAETCTLSIDFSPVATSASGTSQSLSETLTLTDNTLNVQGSSQSINLSGTETNILPQVTAPTFSPAAGTYTSAQSVTISDTASGSKIYYTTDGSTPTVKSPMYTGSIQVAASQTIKAIAAATGYSTTAIASADYDINQTTATPTFSPAVGTYTSAQSVTISDTTVGAVIYYTIDGSSPTMKSTVFSGPIQVKTSQTIQAVVLASGYNASTNVSATYTINQPTAATPTFSVPGGTYTSYPYVTISDTTPGATIYMTTGGATPTTNAPIYTAGMKIPVNGSGSMTLKAIAVAPGYNNSAIASATYTINLPTPTPTFSVATDTYTSAQSVTISDSITRAAIYYTTDGSTPTASSTAYTSAINVSFTETIQAIALDLGDGYSSSAVASATYTINLPGAATTPTFSLATGTYTAAQSVTISDSTTGAVIHYTTDGSTPTASSTAYTGTITVSSTETLKAIAIATGDANSGVASATYTINLAGAVPTPTFSPAAGTYTSAQSVTISDSITKATIYYTTDGSTPTASSTAYTGAITVSSTQTIQAIALDLGDGYSNSAITSAAYTILPAGSPDFTLGVTPATLTVTGGQSGSVTVSVTPQNGFASAVSFTCSGLPTGASCSFSPATVTPSGTAASTTKLTVTTAATTASVHPNSSPLLPASALAAAFCLIGWKKRRRIQLLLLLAVSVMGLSLFTGCGRSSTSTTTTTGTTKPVTSTVTVTGTSGSGSSLVHNTATFSFTVN